MKKEIVYRRFIWIAAVASVAKVFAMMASRSNAAGKKGCEIGTCKKIEKMTDLIEIKLM